MYTVFLLLRFRRCSHTAHHHAETKAYMRRSRVLAGRGYSRDPLAVCSLLAPHCLTRVDRASHVHAVCLPPCRQPQYRIWHAQPAGSLCALLHGPGCEGRGAWLGLSRWWKPGASGPTRLPLYDKVLNHSVTARTPVRKESWHETHCQPGRVYGDSAFRDGRVFVLV